MSEHPAVAARAVTKTFGAVVAIDGVTLEVARGEILGLLGPSGCGKTTFLRLVAGFERLDAGAIWIDGAEVSGARFMPPEKRKVGFVFQDYALFPHLTIDGNVGYGVRARHERAARVAETLELVGLVGLGARYPHELSGGQQQRVALARALAPRPALILLDEPFSSLDADLRVRVRSDVRQILRDAGATAIFVTHDQQEAFEIADRVGVMREGRIEQLGRPEEIYHTPLTRFVADFVGDAEFLGASVRNAWIDTELGSFAVDDGAIPRGDAELMIRPEDIAIESRTDGEATVAARRFHGPVSLTTVHLPSGREVTAAHSSQILFALGERVHVSLRPDHLVLFRGDRRAGVIPARARTGTDAGD